MCNPSPYKTALEAFDAKADTYEASTGGCTRELARYLLSLCAPITPDSIVLDNACGTGIVTQEILFQAQNTAQETPLIYAVDGAHRMIQLGKQNLEGVPGAERIRWTAMAGENLEFADATFTHCVTNLGILFFADARAGASEMYRTLRRGGTALVTSWKKLGYVEVIQAAQRTVKPDAELFQVPIRRHWFEAGHLESTLREGGFEDVRVHETSVHYAAETEEALVQNLWALIGLMKNCGVEEQGRLREELRRVVKSEARYVKRIVSVQKEGEAWGGVGIEMIALVAIARKKLDT